MSERPCQHAYVEHHDGRCAVCHMPRGYASHYSSLHRELAYVLFERAQDGYVNPTGGKTTGRERKDA